MNYTYVHIYVRYSDLATCMHIIRSYVYVYYSCMYCMYVDCTIVVCIFKLSCKLPSINTIFVSAINFIIFQLLLFTLYTSLARLQHRICFTYVPMHWSFDMRLWLASHLWVQWIVAGFQIHSCLEGMISINCHQCMH